MSTPSRTTGPMMNGLMTMSDVRAQCPDCGKNVSVTKGGRLRAHNDGTHGPNQSPRLCVGSGKIQGENS